MTTNQNYIKLLDLASFRACIENNGHKMPKQTVTARKCDFFISSIADIKLDGLIDTPYLSDFFVIYYVTQGSINGINQLKSLQIKTDQIFFSKPGEIKTWQRLNGVEGYMVAFTLEYLLLQIQNKNFINTFDYLLPKAQRKFDLNTTEVLFFNGIFEEMLREFKNPKKHSIELIKSWIFVILIRANRIYSGQYKKEFLTGYKNSAQQTYSRFLIVLEESFKKLAQGEITKIPKVSTFAEQLNINATYLGECIRKASGTSTKTIINKRIMLLAKCQLLHTGNNISEIGYQLGFESSAYFIRFFKKFENVTPLEYRKHNSYNCAITGQSKEQKIAPMHAVF